MSGLSSRSTLIGKKYGVVKLKDDPNQLGTQITLIARIALHLSYSDLTTPKILIEIIGNGPTGKSLSFHNRTPMTARITDREKDRSVYLFSWQFLGCCHTNTTD
jgi:hypothetical protein